MIEALEVRWLLHASAVALDGDDATNGHDEPAAVFVGPTADLLGPLPTGGHMGGCGCNACQALLLGAAQEAAPPTPSGAAPFDLSDTFLLNSRPSAKKTIFLDFDGNTLTGSFWSMYGGGGPIVTPAFSFEGDASFSANELERIQYIWQRVAEDFAPFDVNVTTQDPGSAALISSGGGDDRWGVRVSIGGSYSDWYQSSAGGVAFVGTFKSTTETPVFVFSQNLANSEKYVAEAISHEAGHSLGLSHDGQTSPSSSYYAGHGSGSTGWAPIMGNSYYQEVTQWSKGEYTNPTTTQDDLAIITGPNNFGYRTDDYGNSLAEASDLSVTAGSGVQLVNQAGVIERSTDTDWFKFTTTGGNVSLTFSPAARGANLDLLANLYSSDGQLVASSNPANSLNAAISITLGAGDYYVMLDGVGVRGVSDGYSDYGSLGQYTVTGTIEDASPAENGSISGRVWHDRNGNGSVEPGEEGLNGLVVYVDANNNGVFDSGNETSVTTTADGSYTFIGLAAGNYRIRPVVSVGWQQLGAMSQVVSLASNGVATNVNFAANQINGNYFSVGAISDTNAGSDAVDENAPNGTPVGITAHAIDQDATNNLVTYSLWSNANGRFAIHPVTGVVTVAKSEWLDRESAASWSITVLATSQDGSIAVKAFTINLNDINEFGAGAISDANAASDSVNENSPNGTPVGITARAFDKDATNNLITYSLWSSANGRFAIDPVTGVVTVAKSEWLDREAAASWSITVLATSQDGSASVKAFTINLDDVNEFGVGAIADVNSTADAVNENAPNGTLVGITARAFDKDATNNLVTYSLWSSANGRFAIDPVTGVVTVAKSEWLDREAAESWSITVMATSQDGSASVKAFTINLNDVNEFAVGAISDVDALTDSIDENAPNGTSVGITARAFDRDATSQITYSLWSNANGRFAIDPVTGVVTVAKSEWLDREAAASWSITVLATSQDGSASVAAFTINLNDVNEYSVGAIADVDAGTNSISENAPNGTLVGITARAFDKDATNNSVTYSLVSNAEGRFAIDPVTGVVTVANQTLLDREGAGAAEWSITVQAASQDGSTRLQAFSIAVNDVDEFDVGLITDSDSIPNSILRDVPLDATVGVTATAVDLDATNNSVTYSLSNSAGGRFYIDPVTGVVRVANNALIVFDSATSYEISVVATSSDGSTSSQSFTINMVDTLDAPIVPLANTRSRRQPRGDR